jgi:hypothetical protein
MLRFTAVALWVLVCFSCNIATSPTGDGGGGAGGGTGGAGGGVALAAPSSVSYLPLSLTCVVKEPCALAAPATSGGVPTTFSITPSPPPGLLFDPSTGSIEGTATVVTPRGNYLVTAANSAGSATTTVELAVDDVAPATLTYSPASLACTRGQPCGLPAPSNEGGAVTRYAVVPALPAGLVLSPTTGELLGLPTELAPAMDYLVTATNSGGSTSATVVVSVVEVAPASVVYSPATLTCTRALACGLAAPTTSGGPVVTFSIAPALPQGLALDPASGAIAGTASVVAPAAVFLVTAANSGGSATGALALEVNDVAPCALMYSPSVRICTLGLPCPALGPPTHSGGAVSSYAVTPPLPAGLTLDAATGRISGTPTVLTPSSTYAVTATNSGGSAVVALSIAVNDLPPLNLSYSNNPASYTAGVPITPNVPSLSGGAVVSWAVSPALPLGLSFSSLTGVVSGAPAALAGSALYVVTATNSGGNALANLSMAVVAPPAPVIGTQPSSQTVPYGQPVTFQATASGTGALAWQWRRNGAPISGATAPDYTLASVGGADDGAQYSAGVSDLWGGTATSAVATLTVTGSFFPTGSLSIARSNHSETRLGNGTVLIVGGNNNSGPVAASELYSTAAAAFTTTGSLAFARFHHTATLLADGKVLVVGGAGANAESEVFDPGTGRFETSGLLAQNRRFHTATRLLDGRVLVTGGRAGPGHLPSAELYDPASGLFTPTGPMGTARSYHTATLLLDGRVLVTGGITGGNARTATTEVFDPAAGTFTAVGSLAVARVWHSATRLQNGQVLVIGGSDAAVPLVSAELYDPAKGTFSAAGTLGTGGDRQTATVLSDGRVLVTGGTNGSNANLARAELTDRAGATFVSTGPMGTARAGHTATLLPNDTVLVVGGYTVDQGTFFTDCEVYRP